MLRSFSSSTLQHALDATLLSFLIDFQHALDATLFSFWSNLQHALDSTVLSFSSNFQHTLDAALCFSQVPYNTLLMLHSYLS